MLIQQLQVWAGYQDGSVVVHDSQTHGILRVFGGSVPVVGMERFHNQVAALLQVAKLHFPEAGFSSADIK